VTVININKAPKGWQNNPEYAYIGRTGYGIEGFFGNPIDHKAPCLICGQIHGLPGSTLPCYEIWLQNKLKFDAVFSERFYRELSGKILVCFCKPKPCHGNIILKYLERR